MKFEIGNPSDKCFLESDDEKVAAACILFLGNGHYFCTNTETGEQVAGTCFILCGDVEETWKHFHGIGFEEFISKPETKKEMADCFASFHYAGERSSINNIGKRAKELAESIRKTADNLTTASTGQKGVNNVIRL